MVLCLPKASVERGGEPQDFRRATAQRVYKFPRRSVEQCKTIYGVMTGFGALCNARVSDGLEP